MLPPLGPRSSTLWKCASTARLPCGFLTLFRGRYGSHPGFYRDESRGGRPWLYFYDSYLVTPTEWSRLLHGRGDESIRGTMLDVVAIGLLVEQTHRDALHSGGFDGIYTYFATNGFTFGSQQPLWKSHAEWTKARNMLWVPSIGPGYNDERIRPWNAIVRVCVCVCVCVCLRLCLCVCVGEPCVRFQCTLAICMLLFISIVSVCSRVHNVCCFSLSRSVRVHSMMSYSVFVCSRFFVSLLLCSSCVLACSRPLAVVACSGLSGSLETRSASRSLVELIRRCRTHATAIKARICAPAAEQPSIPAQMSSPSPRSTSGTKGRKLSLPYCTLSRRPATSTLPIPTTTATFTCESLPRWRAHGTPSTHWRDETRCWTGRRRTCALCRCVWVNNDVIRT
jgi:hypothetical protein